MTEPAGLILIGTPIGNLEDISPRAVRTLRELEVIACEDTRRTGRLLSHLGLTGKRLLVTNEHTEASVASKIVDMLDQGVPVGLVSDAGMPSVSDPGQRIVSAVLAAGHCIDVVPGPTAVSTAVVASGFDTSSFVFEGFLARKGEARTRSLEQLASQTRTAVIYESPNRLAATLAELARVLGDDRRVFVGRELTKMYQQYWRGSLSQGAAYWKGQSIKGEIVLVLEGAPSSRAALTDGELTRALATEMAAGRSLRDAVTEVVELTGEPKRRVYELALHLP